MKTNKQLLQGAAAFLAMAVYAAVAAAAGLNVASDPVVFGGLTSAAVDSPISLAATGFSSMNPLWSDSSSVYPRSRTLMIQMAPMASSTRLGRVSESNDPVSLRIVRTGKPRLRRVACGGSGDASRMVTDLLSAGPSQPCMRCAQASPLLG